MVDRLRAGWSPQQIAGRLGQSGSEIGRLSHETIYRFIYGAVGRKLELFRCLAKARKRRSLKFGRKPRRDVIPAIHWISARPADINDRKIFGHWECDLMIFGKQSGKANVTTLMERQTRFTVLLENPDRRTAGVIGAVGKVFSALPPLARQSITFDRGTEFMAFQSLKKDHGVVGYFCDPHSPWQKGAVENTNGRLRRYLPNETPLEMLNDNTLARVTECLNDTPRRCLDYRTPKEAFDALLATLPLAG